MNYRRLLICTLGFLFWIILTAGYAKAKDTGLWDIEIHKGDYYRQEDTLYFKKELRCKIILNNMYNPRELEEVNIYADERLIYKEEGYNNEEGYELDIKDVTEGNKTIIKIKSRDKQGKICEEEFIFIKDNLAPSIKAIMIDDSEPEGEPDKINFYDKEIKVSFNINDTADENGNSDIKDIIFEKYDMEGEKLESIDMDIEAEEGEIYLNKGFKGYFIIRARDNMLNECEAKSQYIIISDRDRPDSLIHLDTEGIGNNGYVNSDINMNFCVTNDFCGIKSVSYRIFEDSKKDLWDLGKYGKTYILDKDNVDNELKTEKSNYNLINKITGQIPIHGNGSIRVFFQVTDNAGVVTKKEAYVKIDKVMPKLNVIYDKKAADKGYFRDKLLVRVEVSEDNFDCGLINISGLPDFGEPVLWSKNKDCYFAELQYDREGEYELGISGMDMAGNKFQKDYRNKFIIDLTNPEIKFSGMEDNSANSGATTLGISVTDRYLNMKSIAIHIKKDGKDIDISYIENKIKSGINYIFKDIPKRRDTEGIYSVRVCAEDLAGNMVEEAINFSINRFGSIYMLSPDLSSIRNKYVRQSPDIKITEINVDKIDRQEINAYMVKNADTVNLDLDKDFYVTESTLQYKNSLEYTFPAGLFAEDGIYTLVIYSKDRAGNINQSVKDNDIGQITFGVDSTAPTIHFLNIKDSGEVDSKKFRAEAFVKDNLKLDKINVYDNGKRIPFTMENERIYFELKESDSLRNISVQAYDMAGNKAEARAENILISESNPKIISEISSRIPVKLPEKLVQNQRTGRMNTQRRYPYVITIFTITLIFLFAGIKIYRRLLK